MKWNRDETPSCVRCGKRGFKSLDPLFAGVTYEYAIGHRREYLPTGLWLCHKKKKCKQRVRNNERVK